MFERETGQCPHCTILLTKTVKNQNEVYACPQCKREFRQVRLNPDDSQKVLVTLYHEQEVLPLNLPKGSIRALIAISLSCATWLCFVTGQPVPQHLLSTILVILGYYFGFRKQRKNIPDVYTPHPTEPEPLFLPQGVIRMLLITGYAITGLILLFKTELNAASPYLEFYILLTGLAVGQVLGKMAGGLKHTPIWAYLAHMKGLLAILCTLLLIYGQMFPSHLPPTSYLMLTGFLSFYYGVRS
jgi:hypothetical protein